jgi:hypothetical protein
MCHTAQSSATYRVSFIVVSVLPVMLQEPGESDLLGKLVKHQLQHKYGGDLARDQLPDGVARACGP